ncbi:MAG: hypothetical protein DDT19_00660 [Syntrophomonadaceae bacterium]|nr:hypothetical protein [Bacillota bacterium]
MRQNQLQQGGAPNPILMLGGIALVVLIVSYMFTLTIAFIRFNLPWISLQAEIYSTVLPSVYGKEDIFLKDLNKKLSSLSDKEQAGLSADKLRLFVDLNTQRTQMTTRVLFFIVILSSSVFLFRMERKSIKRMFNPDENLTLHTDKKGVEGFIDVIGKFLPDEIKKTLIESPTPKNIADAFSLVRSTKNISNAVVARLFPENSEERILLLEYGKKKFFDREKL